MAEKGGGREKGGSAGDSGGEPVEGTEGGAPGEETLTLEERLLRLDEIVGALESGDVELDRGLELFEEGVRHIRQAERVLARAEMRVEELVGGEAALETRPMHGEEEGEENGEGGSS